MAAWKLQTFRCIFIHFMFRYLHCICYYPHLYLITYFNKFLIERQIEKYIHIFGRNWNQGTALNIYQIIFLMHFLIEWQTENTRTLYMVVSKTKRSELIVEYFICSLEESSHDAPGASSCTYHHLHALLSHLSILFLNKCEKMLSNKRVSLHIWGSRYSSLWIKVFSYE